MRKHVAERKVKINLEIAEKAISVISQKEITLDTLYCRELGTGCNAAWERLSREIFDIFRKILNKMYFCNSLEEHKINVN